MSSVSFDINHSTRVYTGIARPQDVDGDTTGTIARCVTAGTGGGPLVGEWWDSVRWSHTGEGDRAGWTVVGRAREREIRWWTVVHPNTHIQI